jgi:AraC-like DNA-binding protein
MAARMTRNRAAGLERSCAAGDWMRVGTARPGFERLEACFTNHAFESHRHDTYAVGITLAGVQAFGYRGVEEHCLAGQAFVLHPDERHDGHAGSDAGFRYRILYIEPTLIQEALGQPRCPLPFVGDAVSGDIRLRAAILAALDEPEQAIDDLKLDQSLVELAEALAALDPSSTPPAAEKPSLRAVALARDYLDAHRLDDVPSKTLEALTGLSRFALTRHFRASLGTSPHRYVVMRRLDDAKRLIRSGMALAEVAASSGFADQSHLTRHFKKTYGLSPGRWSGMLV